MAPLLNTVPTADSDMTLEPRQVNDADREILAFLTDEGKRATPKYVAEETDLDRSYVSQRLKRLCEHGHLERPYRGLYELVDDPRD